ncbi:MAG TPA: porin, partial [Gammaproteobacteria bacterium]|nr:porin [Gammaproteobacteria bacterium]
MNKKLIVTAMGLVLAGGMGLANADVKLYGQLDVSLDATDSDVQSADGVRRASEVGQNSLGYEDDINMNSNTSAVGVKGSEDLGNGMSAFFKVEWDADLVNGGSFKGRDQYIGIKMEQFGKLSFGTMSTAYKSPGSKIDAFYRTPLQMRAVGLQSNLHSGKGEEGQGRATNTARYDSPKFNGVSVMATYTFDSNKQGNVEDDDPYSLGIQYKGGNFYAAAS